MRWLAIGLSVVGLIVGVAWSVEAKTIGRGFISVNMAPIAFCLPVAAAGIILTNEAIRLRKWYRERRASVVTAEPERVVTTEVSLPKYPKS